MTSTDGTLLLSDSVRRTLRERAVRGAPEEVCGILFGERAGPSDGSDGSADPDGGSAGDHATRAVAVENVASTPGTRYELDPAAVVDAVDAADARGEDLVGFYHSHPTGPAHPSAADRERATWRGYVYCIVVPGAAGTPEASEAPEAPDGVAAYRWTGHVFERLRVRVETETP